MANNRAKAIDLKQWASCQARDLGSRHWALLIWVVSGLMAVVGIFLDAARPVLWAVGLGAAGVLCLANVVASRRFHCFFTGPILLAGSILTILREAGVVSLSWFWLGAGVIIALALAFLLEMLVGKKHVTADCCC